MTIYYGSEHSLSFDLEDEHGNPLNPAPAVKGGGLLFFVKRPSGSDTFTLGIDSNVVMTSTGHFRLDLVITEAGRWEIVAIVKYRNHDGADRTKRTATAFVAESTIADQAVPV